MKRKKATNINFLRKYRQKKGYTLKDVAFLLGYESIGVISEWEQGTRIPCLINTLKLSRIYRTLPNTLFFDLDMILLEDINIKERALDELRVSQLSN